MSERPCLAYVFWHWKRPSADSRAYEARQRTFHAALAREAAGWFLGSTTFEITGAPWAAGGSAAYEDWYRVRDFAALGALNEAAVTGRLRAPHDAAAAPAAGGTGAIYALRVGEPRTSYREAWWFDKPPGEGYRELLGELRPLVEEAGAAIWQRQLALGPAREFCLQAPAEPELPARLDALAVGLRTVWPDPGGEPPS